MTKALRYIDLYYLKAFLHFRKEFPFRSFNVYTARGNMLSK